MFVWRGNFFRITSGFVYFNIQHIYAAW